jgi:hypothetical protein
MTKVQRILLTLVVLLSAILACDSAPSKPGTRVDYTYQLNGVAVADFSRDLAIVAIELQRDSLPLPSAVVRFDGDTLDFSAPYFTTDSLYFSLQSPASSLNGTDLPLSITDSTVTNKTFLVTVPDAFTILTINPPNRIVTGLQSVSVSWSGSSNAGGYVLATVRRPYAYTGTGYSAFVTSLNPAGTLPPDAFSLSPGPLPDTGWYYIYVYAYAGAPDSTLTRSILPVPVPSNLADNINDDPWFGQMAALVVANRDSVHVVTQP